MMCLTTRHARWRLLLCVLLSSLLCTQALRANPPFARPLPPQEFTRLTTQLKSQNPRLREQAVMRLGNSADAKVVVPLLALIHDRDENMRIMLTTALMRTYDPRVLAPVRAMMADDSFRVRAAAATAQIWLADLQCWSIDLPNNWTAVFTPQDMDPQTSATMQPILKRLGWEQTKAALQKALDDPELLVRVSAAAALDRFFFNDPRAIPLLLEGMQSPDSTVRNAAMAPLQRWGADRRDKQFVEIALKLLAEEDPKDFDYPVVDFLGACGDHRAVDVLLAALTRKDPQMRPTILQALGRQQDPRVYPLLISYLKDPDARVRGAAANALGQFKNPDMLDHLLPMLDDADARVRQSTVWALVQSRDRRVVKPLLALLPDPQYAQCRRNIILVLEEIADPSSIDALFAYKDDPQVSDLVLRGLANANDPRAGQLILAAVHSKDPARRRAGLNALNWSNPQAVPVLIGLLHDPDVQMRRQAVQGIANQASRGNTAIISSLVAALKDADLQVRRMALQGLANHADRGNKAVLPPLLAALKDADPQIRRIAIDGMRPFRASEPRITPALQVLAKQDPDSAVRAAAVQALLSTNTPDAKEQFFTLVKSSDAAVRRAAIDGMYQRDDRVTAVLLPLLKDADAGVRAAAARKMGYWNAKQCLEPLISLLKDRDTQVRASAIGTLWQIRDERATAAILAQATDPQAPVRQAVMQGLAGRTDTRSTDVLLAGLNDADHAVRAAAVRGLGASGDPRAVAPALTALTDNAGDMELQQAAIDTLSISSDTQATNSVFNMLKAKVGAKDLLDIATIDEQNYNNTNTQGFPLVQKLALPLHGKCGVLLRPALAALADADPVQRGLGAAVLVNAPDPRALPALTIALRDNDALVRRLAARALRTIGDIRAMQPLTAALKDRSEVVQAEAALALGELQDTRATNALLALLASPQPDVRFAAVWALGKIADPRSLYNLTALYPDADAGTQDEILTALGRIGDADAGELLLDVLKTGASEQRVCAITALGQLKCADAVEPLIAILKQPASASYSSSRSGNEQLPGIRSLGRRYYNDAQSGAVAERQTAARALAAIGDPRAIDPLVQQLTAADTRDYQARNAVAQALGSFKDPRAAQALVTAMKSGDYGPEANALADGAVREVSVTPLLAALQSPNPKARQLVLNVLSQQQLPSPRINLDNVSYPAPVPAITDPHLLPALKAQLPNTTGYERSNLLAMLLKLGDTSALTTLQAMLHDADGQTRSSAASVLTLQPDPSFAATLLSLLKDAEAGDAATSALGLLHDAALTEKLAAALTDANPRVRYRAALALCKQGDPRGVELIAALLTGKTDGKDLGEMPYTTQLINALIDVKDPRAVNALLAFLSTTHDTSEAWAVSALWRNDDPSALDALLARAGQELQVAAVTDNLPADYYSRTMDLALGYLRQFTMAPRTGYTFSLPGKLADARMLELCRKLLNATGHSSAWGRSYGRYNNNMNLSLRQKAIWALGASGNPSVVPDLISVLEGGTLLERKEAAIALGHLQDARAIAPLITALRYLGSDARPAVVAALQSITGKDYGCDVDRWLECVPAK